jgi:hypothetical protein
MGNLLYCVDLNEETLRYTQVQRKVDTRQKKYANYNAQRAETVIGGETVKTWET